MGLLTPFHEFFRRRRNGPDRPLYKREGGGSDVLHDFTPSTDEHVESEAEWSEETRKNRRIKHPFQKWCLDLVGERGEVPMSTIIDGGAWVFDCSTSTTTKYLRPMKSEFGPLEIRRSSAGRNVVVLRESPEPSEWGKEE